MYELKLDLANILVQIRKRLVSVVEEEWQELGGVINNSLADPLQPTAILPIVTGIAAGGNIDDLIPVAASINLLSLSLRIVDDCIDMDKPNAFHVSFGVGRATNYAMALNAIAVREFMKFNLPSNKLEELLDYYFQSFIQVCQGQDRDSHPVNTLDEYQEIVKFKTLRAYQFLTTIGSYLSSSDANIITFCSQCGMHLGWMIQILDDIEALWFPVVENIREVEKKTFPVLLGLTINHPNTKKLRDLFDRKEYDRIQICNLLDEMDIRARLMNIALNHRDKAIEIIEQLPNPDGGKILNVWLDWFLRDGKQLLETTSLETTNISANNYTNALSSAKH